MTSCFDFDDNSRTVVRHCLFNNSNLATHGAETSPKGLRHFEVYDNTFLFDDLGEDTLNLCRWIWIRGGTGVITDNVMPDLKSRMWGDPDQIQMIVMSLRRKCLYAGLPYPIPRQVGQGQDGNNYVLDPLYIWNNSGHPRVGMNDYEPDEVGRNLRSVDYIKLGRDYSVDVPKPGYSKYAYPHPLRRASDSHQLNRSGPEVAVQGSLLCNGACLPDPKPEDHLMVLYAIDGTPEIRTELEKILDQFYPDKGLDADSAERLMAQFTSRLKYYLDPASPALAPARNNLTNHYCQPATSSRVRGAVFEKEGRKWIMASQIEPVQLHHPRKMLVPDRPWVMPDREPLVLKVTDTLTLKCIAIPPGEFLMGTPSYMWPYYQEEYPHRVRLTRPFYLAEIPVTQEMYEAVMGNNPSTVKDPQLPVQDPSFAEIERFCRILSEKNGRKVRLPTDAEWEYAARVGTSNPGFPEKFKEQNSSGPEGFKVALKVKSKVPNAWGLYETRSSVYSPPSPHPGYEHHTPGPESPPYRLGHLSPGRHL